METLKDDQLLRRWTESESQWAFAEIGRRYAGLVFNTCLRELGDPMLAEDASQAVFLLLAQKAPKLRREGALAGWLFRTAQLVSCSWRRQERQRLMREARVMQELTSEYSMKPEDNALWDEIAPHLNTALSRLKPSDREAILLRCLQGYSLVETGAALGVTENTARMRVSRALDRLRRHLAKAGVGVSLSALPVLITERGAQAVPVTLSHAVDLIASGSLGAWATGSALFTVSKTASVASELSRAHLLAKGATLTMAIITAKTVAATLGITAVLGIGGATLYQKTRPHPINNGDFLATMDAKVEIAIVPKGQSNRAGTLLSRYKVNSYGAMTLRGSTDVHIMVAPHFVNRARKALSENGIQITAQTRTSKQIHEEMIASLRRSKK